jgi:hypothetical protein
VIEPRTLADGARLLHIGFRKCGTTALQAALRRARLPLASLGVIYPGKNGNQTSAALAVTGRTHGWVTRGAIQTSMRRWDELVAEVAAIEPRQRAVISSEFFDVADQETIRTVVGGLGGDQVHVVVTARPLSKILPSAWQQQVRVGSRAGYEDWLQQVLEGHDGMRTHQTFWERHDQAAVLSRWASVIGPERVTLVVLDEHDRGLPYRSFETMLGVPHGTLEELPDQVNRSLTAAEAELIRRINIEVFAGDITWDEYSTWIRRGAALRMVERRASDPGEPRTQTPRWAMERATQMSAGFLSDIETLGVEVIGDLQSLAASPSETTPEVAETDPELVPIAAAVQAVIGSGYSTRTRTPPPRVKTAPATKTLTSPELISLLTRRIKRRLRRALQRVGSGRHPGSHD